jgi:L-arabinose transport system substrate-binding protein
MFDKQRTSLVTRMSKAMVLTILAGSILAACGTETPTNTPVAPTAAAAPTTAPAAAPTDTAAPAPAGPTNTAKPAESTGGSGPKIAYLTKHLDNPWFIAESDGAKELAKKLNVDLTVQDLQFDSNLALSAMDAVIGSGTKGIAIVVPDQKIGPAVIDKAKAANIPLISVDDYITSTQGVRAPFVGFDSAKVGEQVANAAGDLYDKAGWGSVDTARIVSIEFQSLTVCMDRTNSSNAVWAKRYPSFPQDKILHLPYDGTLNGGINSMQTFITAHPEITNWVLWSCNDDGVLGGVRALESAGVSADKVIGVGLGAHLACDEWNKGKPTGFKSAIYLNPANHSRTAVQELYDNITNGTAIPQTTFIPGGVVTPDNYVGTIVGCVKK